MSPLTHILRRTMRKQISIDVPLEPLIVLIMDEAGHHRSIPIELDLTAQPRKPYRKIASILDLVTLGINPRCYLDLGAT